jgi:hypothetical protein
MEDCISQEHSNRSQGQVHSRVFLLSILVALALFTVGCKKDPRVEFIQGEWFYKDAHLANIPSESAQTTNWVFDHGYFSMDSCCFYEAYFSGNYYVSDRQENELTLELISLKGQYGGTVLFKDDAMTIVIKIDPEADTIKVSNDGPYARISPISP